MHIKGLGFEPQFNNFKLFHNNQKWVNNTYRDSNLSKDSPNIMEKSNSKSKAKPLKLGKHDIICHRFHTVQIVPEELLND